MKTGLFVLVLLTGCALSPSDLRGQGERVDFSSNRPAREVAHCITRNADSFRALLGVSAPLPWAVREDRGQAEVLVSNPTVGGYLLVAEADGAHVKTWLAPNLPWSDTREQLMRGCP